MGKVLGKVEFFPLSEGIPVFLSSGWVQQSPCQSVLRRLKAGKCPLPPSVEKVLPNLSCWLVQGCLKPVKRLGLMSYYEDIFHKILVY